MLSQVYPQGGDSVTLCALSPRDCQRELCFFSSSHRLEFSHTCINIIEWIQEIDYAGKRARRAEEKAARKLRQ